MWGMRSTLCYMGNANKLQGGEREKRGGASHSACSPTKPRGSCAAYLQLAIVGGHGHGHGRHDGQHHRRARNLHFCSRLFWFEESEKMRVWQAANPHYFSPFPTPSTKDSARNLMSHVLDKDPNRIFKRSGLCLLRPNTWMSNDYCIVDTILFILISVDLYKEQQPIIVPANQNPSQHKQRSVQEVPLGGTLIANLASVIVAPSKIGFCYIE